MEILVQLATPVLQDHQDQVGHRVQLDYLEQQVLLEILDQLAHLVSKEWLEQLDLLDLLDQQVLSVVKDSQDRRVPQDLLVLLDRTATLGHQVHQVPLVW